METSKTQKKISEIALLSNVNIEPVAAALEEPVITANGYGSVFEELLRPDSVVYTAKAGQIFLLIDICELLVNCRGMEEMRQEIDCWFETFFSCIRKERTYFVSDVDCRCGFFAMNPDGVREQDIEGYWYRKLVECVKQQENVHIFPLKRIVERLGKAEAYADMMWYLGRIPFGTAAREAIVTEIGHCVRRLGTPKKVLLLDLDNTLWGGVVGEGKIQLGNEKTGLIYKDLQRVIRRMKDCGVVLGIVSKNNPEDAIAVIREHPHMILREEDFAVSRINWEPKDQNIRSIAEELNLGLDSMVFFDDNAAERELIRTSLPEVVVPDFPARAEQLPKVMAQIFEDYFEKWVYTKEDAEKTEQYRANAKRRELQEKQTDYAGFLKSLDIHVKRVSAKENKERLLQLFNKTNQFNLTTTRYTMPELEQILADREGHEVYLFEVSDRFGNNGITAAVIVRYGERAEIESFVMSCRIMGRMVENMVLDYVETDAQEKGFPELYSRYVYTPKSKPVEEFYERCGYTGLYHDKDRKEYKIALGERKAREWYGKLESQREE